MKTILILSFLCLFIITENTAANALQMSGKTVFKAIADSDRENWRTHHPRTWLEFSEDGRTLTFRTNARIPLLGNPFTMVPLLENISQHLNIAFQTFSRQFTRMVRFPYNFPKAFQT